MNDTNERSVASAGSVAGGVVEHAKECVGFWRSTMEGADRIGMEAPSLTIGGVADLVDGLLDEIARLRITDAERDVIEWCQQSCSNARTPQGNRLADTLRGLLERLGGGV